MSDVLMCQYCDKRAEFFPSSVVFYKGRNYGPVWACEPCDAWVGCHPGTTRPLGRLADAALRRAKMHVHAEFDPIWKRGYATRSEAYSQLAAALRIPKSACHIGMMDLEMCARAVAACQEIGQRLATPSRKATP